jgi:hypothetical protein
MRALLESDLEPMLYFERFVTTLEEFSRSAFNTSRITERLDPLLYEVRRMRDHYHNLPIREKDNQA